jgi:4-diphosphocytidyl-2-C-methyl-D-erythritol kinase
MLERSATVRSFAKINVDLRVLDKRRDNYHELRTVFQTISLADSIGIRVRRGRRTRLTLAGNVDIPDNLILRAAAAVLDAAHVSAEVTFELNKRIPMGAGLGGGSSNAAAVLLALPVLAGVNLPMARLERLGAALGSDVPFFLYGGTALGIGRGTELYPLADLPLRHGVFVAPGVHVSTADAYRDLGRAGAAGALTAPATGTDTDGFRALVWKLAGRGAASEGWESMCANDFEEAVFKRHPELAAIKRRLERCGAAPALMTGSGSTVFGLYPSAARAREARAKLAAECPDSNGVYAMTLLTRSRYRDAWRRDLAGHIQSESTWPPRSWYSKQ